MTIDANSLWLDPISPVLRERAVRALERGDVSGFLCTAGNEYGFYLVAHNQTRLRQAGLYEAALLKAYAGTRVNNVHHLEIFLKRLFEYGDRRKFREAGDLLPSSGPFTLYRGVAGAGEKRRERGLSWTSDLELAWWYAYWFQLQKREDAPVNPAVVTATIEESDVIAYVNDPAKGEQEFVVLLPDSATVETLPQAGGLEAAQNREKRKQEDVMKDFERANRELA
jgi:hypothetical protein